VNLERHSLGSSCPASACFLFSADLSVDHRAHCGSNRPS
jgi:hypothetical protein